MKTETQYCDLVVDTDGSIAAWVCKGLDMDTAELGENMTIGIKRGEELIGGLIYNNGRENIDIWWTLYTTDRRWCTRRILKKLFGLAFEKLNCRRINLLVSQGNCKSQELVNRLGFKVEGFLRKYRTNGEDCFIFGMLKNECKWS